MIIFADTAKLEQRMRDMAAAIKDFGHTAMPEELTAWQREDMHRKWPNTDVINYVRVETEIWPRSRGASQNLTRPRSELAPRSRLSTQRGGRPNPIRKWQGRAASTRSSRPILRPELFDKLSARMRELMKSLISWRSTTRP